ncbi:hypothetical protein M431DRAFT_482673 [Trichoderma harzianum CBS 226.95]|uniref:Uncharacterized protein n=1 Tax=Trichoderma harzianum CBS 226.95 TaxID=983964 RepID=A0A2T4A9Q1_TRIHA|nr:hypothetical protein M431DRAFT_482673 [Trichoderma harzianum CBS 226.95]PTB53820.1 hypothetical protein M431DRAFT_482673 [Trichoderma harzianum CBS 226.95]
MDNSQPIIRLFEMRLHKWNASLVVQHILFRPSAYHVDQQRQRQLLLFTHQYNHPFNKVFRSFVVLKTWPPCLANLSHLFSHCSIKPLHLAHHVLRSSNEARLDFCPKRSVNQFFPPCISLSDQRKHSHHVNLPCSIHNAHKDRSSANHDNKYRPEISPSHPSQPTDGLASIAMKKLHELEMSLQSLQSLHSMLKAQHAAQRESTYNCTWPLPWPPTLGAAYKLYKKDDDNWRPLRRHFATHCSRYRDVQPGLTAFVARLRMAISLGDADRR